MGELAPGMGLFLISQDIQNTFRESKRVFRNPVLNALDRSLTITEGTTQLTAAGLMDVGRIQGNGVLYITGFYLSLGTLGVQMGHRLARNINWGERISIIPQYK